ncbi:upstream activation factor subunit spp27-like isoform X1 [Zingiber officinale]|uniref:Uncharacterized protein n=1 Tax=Zingiber officinale TaxID=94328 RepID=A0A8J5HNP1_ZINOF|nr:upstream activation factor subunit spp27-like isoform X1 [Zingiber officinale]KAG6529679.1 hypothetical protein ZIOFF_011892 [Zingiber officinale]
MVSDAELVERLREFVRCSDLSTTTTSSVRRRLEEDFGIDLSQKKGFIRDQVDLFLTELNENREAEEEEKAHDGLEVAKDEEEKVHDSSEAEKELNEEDEEGGSAESDNGDEEEEGDKEDEDEDGEENDDGKSSRKRKTKEISKEVKKRGGGFTKLCSLSPLLQDFVGETELARTEVVKRLWTYIREKDLQDPKNRRKIICDERLHTLFNVNSIDMFQMNKALSKHIWPLNSEESPVAPVIPKESNKKPKKESDGQRQKGQSGFLMPLRLSNELIQFFGTGEDALSRADVVKRMWAYIKGNNLQDPADKRNVICDEKLKELLKVDSFHGFTVSKLLTPHFIKSKDLVPCPSSNHEIGVLTFYTDRDRPEPFVIVEAFGGSPRVANPQRNRLIASHGTTIWVIR